MVKTKSTAGRLLVILANLSLLFFLMACNQPPRRSSENNAVQRVVCLSPAGAEILYAVGAGEKIVGRTDFCDYPARILEVPSVGGFDGKTLSVETIVACRPDLVYGSKGMHDFLKEPLENLGIKVFLSTAESIDEIYSEMEQVSAMVGCGSAGKKYIEENRLERKPIEKPVSVYYEVWYAPYMSSGKSFISDVISYAGGESIFANLNEPYPMVSEESIIAAAPEVIILSRQNGISIEDVMTRKGWQEIPAVKNGRIHLIDGDLISRPGPRINYAVREIEKILAAR